MASVSLILEGARSGKSRDTEQLANNVALITAGLPLHLKGKNE
jgi:adenosyl cobinamide kinase/adenosyl cobinamide phosphate guanylyltransferase